MLRTRPWLPYAAPPALLFYAAPPPVLLFYAAPPALLFYAAPAALSFLDRSPASSGINGTLLYESFYRFARSRKPFKRFPQDLQLTTKKQPERKWKKAAMPMAESCGDIGVADVVIFAK